MAELDPFRPVSGTDDKGTSHKVPELVVRKAFWQWMKSGHPIGCGVLGWNINVLLGEPWRGSHPFDYAAHRLCQRWRKAGLIQRHPHVQGWILTPDGRLAHDNLLYSLQGR